jgi:hypothetical protein
MPATVDSVIEQWPKEPRESAKRLIEYYGPPQEYTSSLLIWHRTHDGWKRTVLTAKETPHEFPAHHTDFLEQFIDYRVPVEMFAALAAYDGSVVADRTRGELSARCGDTSMNFVAVNLAHDIVTGTRTVTEARDEYARLYRAYKKGESSPYTQGFQFALADGDTRDPDSSVIA